MRSAFPVVAFVTLVATVLGCDTAPDPSATAKLKELSAPARTLEQTLQRVHAQLGGKVEPGPCSDLTIRTAINKSQSRTVPFIDAAALALTAQGKPLDPGLPFAQFVSKVLTKRRPTSAVSDEKSATDAAFDAMTLSKEHDFLAAMRYDFQRAKADGQGFHGGELKGTLALFELRSGKLLCAAPVFAQSHEEIAGKPGQSPQEAADVDLELESRRALEETFAGMTRELNLDLG